MNVKLTPEERRRIFGSYDIYDVMQRILLRENKIDIEKEHFWGMGLNNAGVILYIELISLGSVRKVVVEPMNVYRVAVLKGATQLVVIHNHPSGSVLHSEADEDITDRLIQSGKILGIELIDHLIITPETYISFADIKLMDKLNNSIKYIPKYQAIEKIRKEGNELRKSEKKLRLETEKKLSLTISTLIQKQVTVDEIAELLSITPKEVNQIINKIKKQDKK